MGTNNDEIVAILGHELGHWKLNHVTYSLLISEVGSITIFNSFNTLVSMFEITLITLGS